MVYYYIGPQDLFEPLFEPPVMKEIRLPSGGILHVEMLGPDEFRVISLSSTDPTDFLDPRYSPGTIIHPSIAVPEK